MIVFACPCCDTNLSMNDTIYVTGGYDNEMVIHFCQHCLDDPSSTISSPMKVKDFIGDATHLVER